MENRIADFLKKKKQKEGKKQEQELDQTKRNLRDTRQEMYTPPMINLLQLASGETNVEVSKKVMLNIKSALESEPKATTGDVLLALSYHLCLTAMPFFTNEEKRKEE